MKGISVKKRARQAIKNRAYNRSITSKVKTSIKKVRSNEFKEENLRHALSLIDKASAKGVFHKNKSARIKSRLMRHVHLSGSD